MSFNFLAAYQRSTLSPKLGWASNGDSGSVATAAHSHEALRPSRRAQEGAELLGSGSGCCAAG